LCLKAAKMKFAAADPVVSVNFYPLNSRICPAAKSQRRYIIAIERWDKSHLRGHVGIGTVAITFKSDFTSNIEVRSQDAFVDHVIFADVTAIDHRRFVTVE